MLHRIDEISGIGLYLDLVLKKIQDAYLEKFDELALDLTIEQWVVLYRISQLGSTASQSDIVKSNFRNRATTSRILSGLERKGWVVKARFDGDQKRFKLQLTEKGQHIITTVQPHAIALRKKAVENLDPAEFEIFLKILNQIGDNYS